MHKKSIGKFNRIRRVHDSSFAELWEVQIKDRGGLRILIQKVLRYPLIMKELISITPEERKANLDRIQRDMEKWVSLCHRNIMPLVGFQWEPEPSIFFIRYENGNLKQYLQSHPSANKLKLLIGVADGLAYLHKLTPPIVHGDLKPSNVIIADGGHPMLCDFGMADDINVVSFGLTLPANELYGYLAPEIIEGYENMMATDVYMFGCLMLEVFSGHMPFFNMKQVPALQALGRGITPSPEDHPKLPADSPFWPIMYKCWTNDPVKRPTIQDIKPLLVKQEELPASYLGVAVGLVCSIVYGFYRVIVS